MNSNFKFKLLSHLTAKKENKGFTLIELLVVVIIIGVLAAIALPNLLGQVGKARESEAKSTIGAVNRAQQQYYTEKQAFATTSTALEIPLENFKFYKALDLSTAGVALAVGQNNIKNGTRDYTGGVSYNGNGRTFASVVCRAVDSPDFSAAGSGVVDNYGDLGDPGNSVDSVECLTAQDVEEVK